MNLTLLKTYFTHLLNSQQRLQQDRQTLPDHLSAYSLYRLLAPRSEPKINAQMLATFVKSWTYHFTQGEEEEEGVQSYPLQDKSTEELMLRAVELFLNKWGQGGEMSF